jgi:Abnormal spindle-like microcephaly-assoc'd, ASPM-SPD-2-Hydin/Bacterial Ig-like domain (group 2)/Dockerin type I domain
MNTHRWRIEWRIVSSALLAALAVAHVSEAGQAPALLAISSPASNAVINPGQTMTVNVTSPANVTFVSVGVVAERPIGISTTLATGVPAQFTLDVPADIACRRYIVTADGTTAAGQEISTSVTIDVERSDMPTSIRAAHPSIGFEAPGASVPIRILGAFTNGKVLDVTRSTNVVYESSDPTVATVSASGEVTALAAGDAVITVTYGPRVQNIIVTIPVNVPAPIFSIDPAQLNFGQQNVGTSASLQVTLTNTTEGDLEIASITARGDYSVTDTCVSSRPIAVNATCTITVNFAPTATGARAGAIRIENGVTILPVAFGVTGTALDMRCDANGDGLITQADLVIIRNANGQFASGPHDPRDGNGDGSINILDARYCQLRLTPQ